MSETHHKGQIIATCPDCGQTSRLKPPGLTGTQSRVICGCGREYHADRETGEVLP